jgi:hypothetical protein
MQVRDKVSQANEAVLLIRGIRQQIQERRGRLDAKAAAALKALDDLDSSL